VGQSVPVELADAVCGLNRTNPALVLAAVSHSNGAHRHREYLAERRTADGTPVLGPDSPGLELGPVFAWPGMSSGPTAAV